MTLAVGQIFGRKRNIMKKKEFEKKNDELFDSIMAQIQAKCKELGIDCDTIEISVVTDFTRKDMFGFNVIATPIKNEE